MKTVQFFSIVFIITLFGMSCKKDNDTTPNNNNGEDLAALVIGDYSGYFYHEIHEVFEPENYIMTIEKVDNNTIRLVCDDMDSVEFDIMRHPDIEGRLDKPSNFDTHGESIWYYEANNDDFMIFTTADEEIGFYGNRVDQ